MGSASMEEQVIPISSHYEELAHFAFGYSIPVIQKTARMAKVIGLSSAAALALALSFQSMAQQELLAKNFDVEKIELLLLPLATAIGAGGWLVEKSLNFWEPPV